jgi:hypothetical protein
MTVFVPPEVNAKNWVVVTTFTVTATGEMATEIPVAGSVHEEEEEELEVVPVVVVQTTSVLGAAPEWQEARPAAARIKANRERRFTAHLSSMYEASAAAGSIPGMLDS